MDKFLNSGCGSLHLIVGPMFAGKSSELMKVCRRLSYAKKKILVINYMADNRYSDKHVISTHDKIHMEAVKAEKIQNIADQIDEYDVIAIDEGQFFDDIAEYSNKFADMGKIVIVAALDGTFERKNFGGIHELMAGCESITKLTAVCLYCNHNASFTRRTIKKSEVKLIGSHEMYEPVCRGCYIQLELNDKLNNEETLSEKSVKSDANSDSSIQKNTPMKSDSDNMDIQSELVQ